MVNNADAGRHTDVADVASEDLRGVLTIRKDNIRDDKAFVTRRSLGRVILAVRTPTLNVVYRYFVGPFNMPDE